MDGQARRAPGYSGTIMTDTWQMAATPNAARLFYGGAAGIACRR